MERVPPVSISIIAGGAAGLIVDMSLFPIDTLKTRLQSEAGFLRSGGFKNVYRGILPAATGSVPCAAIFFCTYNSGKSYLGNLLGSDLKPFTHLLSASAGEVAACSEVVPVEILKQRLQATSTKNTALQLANKLWKEEGFLGFYRGFSSTVLREVPFSCLQFPLWEMFKEKWQQKKIKSLAPWEGAICGSLAGGISAALTTPLDVAKTRIMLFSHECVSQSKSQKVPSVMETLHLIYRMEGVNGLFAGITPRVLWITVGGMIFFGVYEYTVDVLDR